ncbi:DNA-binding protein [Streptomyces sp. NPDC020571]|uniref:MmyB family transcriptional regulator n=1 Tax=Streptomyces sp. NPDC020571 TaxID=3365079 RepID=UPI0037A57E08
MSYIKAVATALIRLSAADGWDADAAATVALLRAEAGREPHDRALRELIGELSTLSADFRTLWAAHDVRIRHEGVKRLQHPKSGLLRLTYQSPDLPVPRRVVHDAQDHLRLLASLAATRARTTEPTDPLG